MAAFKAGDRVRIVCPGSSLRGREATVIGEARDCLGYHKHGEWHYAPGFYYPVCVDGVGATSKRGLWLGYMSEDLEPLTPPPLAADILTMERLPEWNCPLPEVVS